jgi:hypothetical protein
MLSGGFCLAGLWMLWLAGRATLDAAVRRHLAASGGRLLCAAVPVQALLGCWVYASQPEPVRQGLASAPVYATAGAIWLSASVLMLGLGAWSAWKRPTSAGVGATAAALAVGSILAWTVWRDGIRDLTLAARDFDVWNRQVLVNVPVLGLFLVSFVAGLGAVGWLISIMRRAKRIPERVA